MARVDARTDFTDFVVARRPHLRRLAYALCGDWHTAEDVVQTALARLYARWPSVQRAGSEEAYCRRVIVNAVIDTRRRPWRREAPGLEGFDHAAREVDPLARHELVVALAQLPPMQRCCVVLRHWWGLSVAETAAELGIGEGTVKSHTSRALAGLHDLMSTEGALS